MKKIPSRTQHIITLSSHAEKLMETGETVFVKKGTVFIRAGKPSDYCYIVKSGKVVSTEAFSNGKIRDGLIMVEGSLVGEAFVLLGEMCPTNFKAIEDSHLVKISRQQLIRHLSANPELYTIIIESLSKKLLSTMDEVRQMAGCNVTWRICNLLLVFAQHYGKDVDGMVCIDTNISQQHIAYLLYLNRITVVRVFKKLQDKNLLVRIDKHYYIPDMDAFKAYMELAAYSDKV